MCTNLAVPCLLAYSPNFRALSLASFPDLPLFFALWFAFSIIYRSRRAAKNGGCHRVDVRWTKRKEGVNIQICTSYASFVWNIWSSEGRIFGDDDPVWYLLLRLGPSLPLHPSHVHLTTFTWWISTGFPHFCHPFVPVYTKCELKREASEQGHPTLSFLGGSSSCAEGITLG